MAQHRFKVGDVVTSQHGVVQVQQAVTEAMTGLDELVPRVAVAHPVHRQAAGALERLHGGHRAVAVLVVARRRHREARGGEAGVEVADVVAARSGRKGQRHQRGRANGSAIIGGRR